MTGSDAVAPAAPRRKVLATLVVTGVLLAAALLSRSFTGSAVATEVVRPPVPAASSAPVSVPAAPVRQRDRVVVLGDSVPAASGCSCIGFGTLVADHLAAASGLSTPLTNAAQDGLTTAGLISQLQDPGLLAQLRVATVVTVTIGANDFDADLAGRSDCDTGSALSCYGQQLTASTSLLKQLFGLLRTSAPQARILVTGYWNVFLDGAVGQQQGAAYVRTSDALTRALNGAIQQQAQLAGLRYVDIYTPFKTRSAAGLTALLAPDGDHPSEAGHQLIAAALTAAAQVS